MLDEMIPYTHIEQPPDSIHVSVFPHPPELRFSIMLCQEELSQVSWFRIRYCGERLDRDAHQRPTTEMEVLGLNRGHVVADDG